MGGIIATAAAAITSVVAAMVVNTRATLALVGVVALRAQSLGPACALTVASRRCGTLVVGRDGALCDQRARAGTATLAGAIADAVAADSLGGTSATFAFVVVIAGGSQKRGETPTLTIAGGRPGAIVVGVETELHSATGAIGRLPCP